MFLKHIKLNTPRILRSEDKQISYCNFSEQNDADLHHHLAFKKYVLLGKISINILFVI